MLGAMAMVSTDDPEARRHRWEELTTWPLMAVALVFLGAFAWPIVDTGLDPGLRRACAVVLVASWWAFLIDYVVRLLLARRRMRFVRRHLTDLASVAIPMLRPLLLLRVIGIFEHALERNLSSRLTVYVVTLTGLGVGVGSLAALSAEQGQPESNINDLPTALWWSLTTVTTVGYGDHFPVTGQGRLVATMLMLLGIGLLGVVTASLASFIVDRVGEEEESIEQRTFRDVERLVHEVRALREELAELRGATSQPGDRGT